MPDIAPTPLQRMELFLQEQSIGHLGLVAEGELYVVPLNYTYSEQRILFHCALAGRKLDMIRSNPEVCFEVSTLHGDPQEHPGRKCNTPFESVICWGTARIIEDLTERAAVLQEFQVRYGTPEKPREALGEGRAKSCGAVEIRLTKMTGRDTPGSDHGFGEALEWQA